MKLFQTKGTNFGGIIRIALAIAVTLVLFVVMYSCTYITYTTTDDVALMQRISGAFNGEPMTWASFISPLLTWFIALLYRLFPNVPCYPLLQIAVMFMSIAVINSCIMKQFFKHTKALWMPLLIVVPFTIAALGFMLVRMHFYYVSVLSGTAAIAVILTNEYKGKKGILSGVLTIFLVFVCMCYSLDSSYALLCYVALAVGYRVVMAYVDGDGKKKLLMAGACAVVIVGMLFGFKNLYRSERIRVNGQEYVEWNSYRVSYWDYDVTPYKEDPELYESVGWSKEFYLLTQKMYFMDEKFEAEELSQLVDKFNRTQFSNTERTWTDALQTGQKLFKSSPIALILLVVCIGFYVVSLVGFRWEKKQFFRVLASTFSCLGSLILCLYLCYRGRFPLRAFAPIAIPCVVFLAVNMVDIIFSAIKGDYPLGKYSKEEAPKRNRKKIFIPIFAVILSAVFVFGIVKLTSYLSDEDERVYYEDRKERERIVYDYVSTHKDGLYVFDSSMMSTYDPFSNTKRGDLSNLFCWGGARLHTYAHRHQIAINGRTDLNSDAFLEDGVYLLIKSETNLKYLFNYLYSEYGADTCVVTEMLEKKIMVVKFYKDIAPEALEAMNPVKVLTKGTKK